jgi:hypothetical protein
VARKLTVRYLRWMVDELLTIQAVAERYKQLEKDIKDGMVKLDQTEIETDKGRVFISQGERVTIPVEAANEVLGLDLAGKVIQIKKSVSNKLVDAFSEAGEIDGKAHARLLELADHKPVISLYVRPLK